MEKLIAFGKSQAKRILAVTVILALLALAQLPALSQSEKSAIASRFAFTRLPLPEVTGFPKKQERGVNPSLARHSAWVSAVGASVALNDLDGDSLANDLCYVEPRTDQVIVHWCQLNAQLLLIKALKLFWGISLSLIYEYLEPELLIHR